MNIREIQELLTQLEDRLTTRRTTELDDAFAAILETALLFDGSQSHRANFEKQRRMQKTLTGALGDFHQSAFGLLPGWTSYTSRDRVNGLVMPDLVGRRGKQKIIVELKNKYNTMNSRSADAVYEAMNEFLEREQFRDHIGIVAHVVSKQTHQLWNSFCGGGSKVERGDLISMNARNLYAIATDPICRQPTVDFDEHEDLTVWPSAAAFDEFVEKFCHAVEELYGFKIPREFRQLF